MASLFRSYLKFLLFYLSLSNSLAEEYYIISDIATNYIIQTTTLKKNNLKRFLYPHKNQKVIGALTNYLDSLGYFNYSIDSTTLVDTIIINTGNRSLIDTFIVTCDSVVLNIDSIHNITFPLLYNSGVIDNFSNLCLSYFVRRGYPFTQIILNIIENQSSGKKTETEEVEEKYKRLKIIFSIKKNELCVFDDPLFHGDFKTSPKIISQDIVFKKEQLYNDDKVKLTRQRLLSRKYISDVSISTPGILLKNRLFNFSDSTVKVVIPIKISDNSGMGVDGAVSYQSQADINWSGLLTISILNILHHGEEAELFYRGEENLQQFDFSISLPFPFMLPIFCSASFGLEIESKNYGYLSGEFKVLTLLKKMWQAGGAIVGHETTVTSGESSWYYIGMDLILDRQSAPYRSQTYSRSLYIRTGTGIANRKSGRFYRWHFDFSINSHIPLFKRQAFLGKIVTKIISSDKNDSLHQVEKIRIGGHNSIRGYAENLYSFSSVVYSQADYMFYYNTTGSVYIFMDGGIGFAEKISTSSKNHTDIFGYGVGIRIPVKFGRLSIEWARNFKETRGLGRIHVRITNNLSSGINI